MRTLHCLFDFITRLLNFFRNRFIFIFLRKHFLFILYLVFYRIFKTFLLLLYLYFLLLILLLLLLSKINILIYDLLLDWLDLIFLFNFKPKRIITPHLYQSNT